jgi:hypothetical protein
MGDKVHASGVPYVAASPPVVGGDRPIDPKNARDWYSG